MKTKIRISDVLRIAEEAAEINKTNFEEIEWLDENGAVIPIDEKILKDFKFTGLNNMDFIKTGFYKTGFDEIIVFKAK